MDQRIYDAIFEELRSLRQEVQESRKEAKEARDIMSSVLKYMRHNDANTRLLHNSIKHIREAVVRLEDSVENHMLVDTPTPLPEDVDLAV